MNCFKLKAVAKVVNISNYCEEKHKYFIFIEKMLHKIA